MKSLGSYARSFWSQAPKVPSQQTASLEKSTSGLFVEPENLEDEFVNVTADFHESDEEKVTCQEHDDGLVFVDTPISKALESLESQDESDTGDRGLVLIHKLEEIIIRESLAERVDDLPTEGPAHPEYLQRVNQISLRFIAILEELGDQRGHIDSIDVYSNMIIAMICSPGGARALNPKSMKLLASLWAREWKIDSVEAQKDIIAIREYFLNTPKKNLCSFFDVMRSSLELPHMTKDKKSAILDSTSLRKWLVIINKLNSNAALLDADFSSLDLRHLDLSGLNLRFANFSKAKLKGANFVGSDLYGAQFIGTDLDQLPNAKNVRQVKFAAK